MTFLEIKIESLDDNFFEASSYREEYFYTKTKTMKKKKINKEKNKK